MALTLRELQADDQEGRNQWYVLVRFLLLLVIGVPSLIALVIFQGLSDEFYRDSALLATALATNALLYILLKRTSSLRYQRLLAMIWLALDVLLVTTIIFINGAIESRSVILYTMPILIAGALFGKRGTYAAAISSGVLYSGLLIADYNHLIPEIGVIEPKLHGNMAYLISSVSFVPSILLVIAMGVDFIIGMLQHKERQAVASLEALNRAQEIARIGSWEWDVEKDEIHWSDGLFKIFGLPVRHDSIDYQSYLKMVHPEDAPSHSRTVQRALRDKKPFTVDHRSLLADGTVKYMHGEGVPTLNAAGEVIRMSGTSQDVTEARHLDEAKRDFVSLASHQLRTPASGVKAFLSLLLDGYAGDITREQRDFILKAQHANDRQLDIIENLLNLAAIESGKLTPKRQPVDVSGLVKLCLPSHTTAMKAQLQKLVTNYAKEPVMVDADPVLLQMVIDNLVSNASKYTPPKGQVTVTISATKSAALVSVSDTGIGIESKDIPALFKKFSRLRDPASKTVGGSGLGLYIAHYVVQLHGGSITVRSRHGEGTTFKIRLPLSAGKGYHKKNERER